MLSHWLCPGDLTAMTAAIHSLHRQFPGRYLTAVNSNHPEIFEHNPDVSHFRGGRAIDLGYDAINGCDARPVHIVGAFTEDLALKLNLPGLRLQTNRPHLYLTDAEREPFPGVPSPYVLVNAGVKSDYTCKGAGRFIFQSVVDHFRGRLTFVQVGQRQHEHKPLSGVVDLIGQTGIRDLFRLIHGSVCGLGPLSFLHHAYAGLERPYVCYLGGREPVSWITYPRAILLHTLGQLPCCADRGCWRFRVVPIPGATSHNDRICALPLVQPDGETVPGCHASIGPGPAIEAIGRILDNL